MITVELCSQPTDMDAAFKLLEEMNVSNDLKPPPKKLIEDRYLAQELVVGKDDDKVVGFYMWHKEDDGIGRYLTVYVAEDYRLRGIGTLMCDLGKDYMKSRGITIVDVGIVPRADIQGFMASRGHIKTGIRPTEEVVLDMYEDSSL